MDPKQPESQKEDRTPIKSLRTYQGDVEEALHKNNFSATTILVAEQKRRESAPRVAEKHINLEARNKFFTVLGIALLFIGALVVTAVYYVRSHQQVVIEQKTKALMEFSVEKTFATASSTRDSLISEIISEKNSFKNIVNSVLYINTTDSSGNPEKVERVLSLLAPNMPASLARSFDDKYMLGIFSYDTNEAFIILTTSDYASSYAGMLKWETGMQSDLGKVFDVQQNASTTNTFVDEALRNKDLRILRDAQGKTTLLYSFIDKNTLVITKNENIFNAILAKYLTSKNTR